MPSLNLVNNEKITPIKISLTTEINEDIWK
jgi:hypothetical protein